MMQGGQRICFSWIAFQKTLRELFWLEINHSYLSFYDCISMFTYTVITFWEGIFDNLIIFVLKYVFYAVNVCSGYNRGKG